MVKVFNLAPDLDAGVAQAQAEGKPILVIVHKSTCPACKRLLPQIGQSNDLKNLGKQFVIINSVDGSDPKAEKLGKAYFPRYDFFIRFV